MRLRRKRRKDAIDRLYDSFVVKDLTREGFRQEYLKLMDPDGLNKDLRRMIKDRQGVETVNVLAGEKKREIDDAVVRSRI